MLKGTIATSMNFNSVIDGKLTVYMSAQIPENGFCKHQHCSSGSGTCTKRIRRNAGKTLRQFNKLVYAAWRINV